jgi:hypothetical protein
MNRPFLKKCALVALLFFTMSASGCRDRELLYEVQNHTASVTSVEQRVRDLIGESKVDVLWVIDNSLSMGSHQNAVIAGTSAFMAEFTRVSTLHWRMGLLSSDRNQAPFVGLDSSQRLQWDSVDPVRSFQNAVGRLGINGSYSEAFRDPVLGALLRNPDFFRPGAHLVLISVTDDQDWSSATPDRFKAELAAFKGDLKKVSLYGIYGATDLNCSSEFWTYAGSDREDFIQQTGGKMYRICDPAFATNLVEIGKSAVKKVISPKIFLRTLPIVRTIRVLYQGRELAAGPAESGGVWFYDPAANAIIFHDLGFSQSDVDSVKVEYVADDGFQTP